MHRILVIDDEETIRKNLDRLLSLEGYEVATASDGQHGLAVACSMRPTIIITDINMPQMDGFALLEAVRSHPELERTAVIMLTAAEDRSYVRKGMARGADDYITKPFKREELLEAIAAQLAKINRFERHKDQAVSQAQLSQQADISPAAPALAEPSQGNVPARHVQATVLFANIINFTALAQHLSEDELVKLLNRYFAQICQPVIACGGTHLKMLGDGLLALFEDDRYAMEAGSATVHASRALHAAMALHAAAQEFRARLAHSYGARGLPELHVGIGLHSGEVTLAHQGQRGVTPLGHTVDAVTHLHAAGKMRGWAVTASTTTVLLAGSGVQLGREHAMGMQEVTPLPNACEVLGYRTRLDLQQGLDREAMAFENAVVELAARENAHATARAAKAALLQRVV
jgi:serine/threonine-protein kinase PpkA